MPGAIPDAGPEVVEKAMVASVHVPTLTVYPAPRELNSRAGVVVCPGGGYARLAVDKEGTAVAGWLNSLGLSAFVRWRR